MDSKLAVVLSLDDDKSTPVVSLLIFVGKISEPPLVYAVLDTEIVLQVSVG